MQILKSFLCPSQRIIFRVSETTGETVALQNVDFEIALNEFSRLLDGSDGKIIGFVR